MGAQLVIFVFLGLGVAIAIGTVLVIRAARSAVEFLDYSSGEPAWQQLVGSTE